MQRNQPYTPNHRVLLMCLPTRLEVEIINIGAHFTTLDLLFKEQDIMQNVIEVFKYSVKQILQFSEGILVSGFVLWRVDEL